MVRREAQRLDDIANSIGEIRRFTAGMEAKAHLADRQVQQAVAWTLIKIGAAIEALPSDLRERHEAVAWTKWAGMRDVLVHQYFRIHHRRIWRIIQHDIPPLEAAVTAELRRIVPDP